MSLPALARRWTLPALVACCTAVSGANRLHAQTARTATHLVTHSRVEVARPASAIWPFILDPTAWKQGLRLVHHSGPVGEVGETFAAVSPSAPAEPAYFVQNVELVPNQRRTVKLYEKGGVLIGFATFTLEASNGGTVVGYDVYTETVLPPERASQLTAAAVVEMERAARESSTRRFQAELESLKRLVESRRVQ